MCTAGVAVGAGVWVGAGVNTWGMRVGNTVGVDKETASEAGVGVGPVITRPLQPIAPPRRRHTISQLHHIRRHRRCLGYFITVHLPDLRAKLYHALHQNPFTGHCRALPFVLD